MRPDRPTVCESPQATGR